MTRKIYDEQLQTLWRLISEMGELNNAAMNDTVTALETMDTTLAGGVKKAETAVDEKETEIERLCVKLILKQQPVAGDLMFITSAMKMVTDMERITDQAVDICGLIVKMSRLPYAEVPAEIYEMAAKVRDMVAESTDSFLNRDAELAKATCRADDAVDDLFEIVKGKLTKVVYKEIEDDENGEQALDLLMIAKYLEKIGDHASNVAEWVVYMVTGEHKKLN